MKPKKFTGGLCLLILLGASIISSSFPVNNTDSVARFRKPIAQFLIGEHYRAEKESQKLKDEQSKNAELQSQNAEYKKMIISYRIDSVACDSLNRLEKQVSQTYKESYDSEVKKYKKTRKKLVLTWVGIGAFIVVRGAVYLISPGRDD